MHTSNENAQQRLGIIKVPWFILMGSDKTRQTNLVRRSPHYLDYLPSKTWRSERNNARFSCTYPLPPFHKQSKRCRLIQRNGNKRHSLITTSSVVMRQLCQTRQAKKKSWKDAQQHTQASIDMQQKCYLIKSPMFNHQCSSLFTFKDS